MENAARQMIKKRRAVQIICVKSQQVSVKCLGKMV